MMMLFGCVHDQPLLWWLLAGWIAVLCMVMLFGVGYVLGADRWAARQSMGETRRGA
jgi:Ni,Fe-hydrogenase I cytochrome b subunit